MNMWRQAHLNANYCAKNYEQGMNLKFFHSLIVKNLGLFMSQVCYPLVEVWSFVITFCCGLLLLIVVSYVYI